MTTIVCPMLRRRLVFTSLAFVLIFIFLFDFCLHCPFAIAKAIDGNDCKSKGQTKIKGQIRIKTRAKVKLILKLGTYYKSLTGSYNIN